MSSAQAIVAECERLGVTLEAHGGNIRIQPASAVPAELKSRLREAKADVLALLAARESHAEATAKSDRSPLLSVVAVPSRGDPPISAAEHGVPEYGCWVCEGREFARDLAHRDWVCTRCHPDEEYRAHLPRCTSRHPSRRGGRTSDPKADPTDSSRRVAERTGMPVVRASGPLLAVGAGGPQYGCVRCGLHVYARTPERPEWMCASCVRPDAARTDVDRWTAPEPARRPPPLMHGSGEAHAAHALPTPEQLAHDCQSWRKCKLPCGCWMCFDCGWVYVIRLEDDDEPPKAQGGAA